MKMIFKKVKEKYEFFYKNRKKGFTLLESIIALALFAIAGVILTMFVIGANNHVIGSYQIERNRTKLTQSITTNKNIEENGIINNKDPNNALDDIGANQANGKINIGLADAIVIGPPKRDDDGNLLIENGKLISQYEHLQTNYNDVEYDVEYITSTKYDENGRPIAQFSVGVKK